MALHIRIVGIVILLFLFIVPHVLPRPPRRRRGRFIVPAPTNTPKMALHIRIVGVAIHRTTTTKYPETALQFILFRHINTIWFGLKNGRDESAPTPYGMFAAIHLRNKWILRNVRCHTFALPISLFLFIVLHVLPRPPRRRRGRFIVPVPTNTPKMALHIPIVDIAIHHTAPTNTHKMALRWYYLAI